MQPFNMESAVIVVSVTVAAMYVIFRIKDALTLSLGKSRSASGCRECGCAAHDCGLRPRKQQRK